MKHLTPNPADLAPLGAILAPMSKQASAALASLMPGADLAQALDRYYGKGKWFVFWDEDLSGKPVRGTLSLAYGNETLIIG